MPEGITQKVRKAANDLGEFTMDRLEETIPVKTFKERRDAREAIRRLIQRNEIVPAGPDRYRYQAARREFSKRARMWRAMRIKGSFTQQDIVRLSGASRNHAEKYFRSLKKQGLVEVVARRGYEKGLYRLKDPDSVPLEHPKLIR